MCVCGGGGGGGGGGGMVKNYCPEKYWSYKVVCGESVRGYGNGSTGKWVK